MPIYKPKVKFVVSLASPFFLSVQPKNNIYNFIKFWAFDNGGGAFFPKGKKKNWWSLRPRPKLLGHGPTLGSTTLRSGCSQDHPKLEKIFLYIKFKNS